MGRPAEARMDQEVAFHIERDTARLMREQNTVTNLGGVVAAIEPAAAPIAPPMTICLSR